MLHGVLQRPWQVPQHCVCDGAAWFGCDGAPDQPLSGSAPGHAKADLGTDIFSGNGSAGLLEQKAPQSVSGTGRAA
jgi:hypothetical protein